MQLHPQNYGYKALFPCILQDKDATAVINSHEEIFILLLHSHDFTAQQHLMFRRQQNICNDNIIFHFILLPLYSHFKQIE